MSLAYRQHVRCIPSSRTHLPPSVAAASSLSWENPVRTVVLAGDSQSLQPRRVHSWCRRASEAKDFGYSDVWVKALLMSLETHELEIAVKEAAGRNIGACKSLL